ncbi:MAG TPA: ATP-binding protein [Pseudomonadales bacterium]|nr:ATP-binding protein [Pseudomonadales bacterium]
MINWQHTVAAVWREQKQILRAIQLTDQIRLQQLVGIDSQKNALIKNTERFLGGLPTNNALLWGARGTGKSSLIKALLNEYHPQGLRLIEVYKNDLHSLHDIVDDIRNLPQKFILYCDDFSFEANDNSYVALKTVLDGSIEAPAQNIVLYATSNRRHLMPEYMSDNLASGLVEGELHYADAIEEKISLADRFGLSLSFYQPDQAGYLAIVDSYFPHFKGDRRQLHQAAKMFAATRASKSGRTAKQFFNAYVTADGSNITDD